VQNLKKIGHFEILICKNKAIYFHLEELYNEEIAPKE